MRVICFDIEVVKAIPQGGEPLIGGVDYCAGFDDKANMGVSVIAAVETDTSDFTRTERLPHVFLKDNFKAFEKLCDDAFVVGWNSQAFDDKVLKESEGIEVVTDYDLLIECAVAEGHKRPIDRRDFRAAGGYGLDDIVRKNGQGGKSDHGKNAPIKWQQGRHGEVIDYCLRDAYLTAWLFNRVLKGYSITSPRTGKYLYPRNPNPW